MVEVTFIPASGTASTKMVDGALETYQGMVGGYIETIPVGPGSLMVVNEEGLIHRLPLNRPASMLTGRTIVGDVFLIDRKDFT